jgi:hypothetical protein
MHYHSLHTLGQCTPHRRRRNATRIKTPHTRTRCQNSPYAAHLSPKSQATRVSTQKSGCGDRCKKGWRGAAQHAYGGGQARGCWWRRRRARRPRPRSGGPAPSLLPSPARPPPLHASARSPDPARLCTLVAPVRGALSPWQPLCAPFSPRERNSRAPAGRQ